MMKWMMKNKSIGIAQVVGLGLLTLIALAWAGSDLYQLTAGQTGQSIPFLGPLAMLAMVAMGGWVEFR